MRFLKNEKNNYGFTIIEVLVVVSIIGLLASAAVYLVNNAREKGRIAAILQFTDGLRASLAGDVVSYWSFDKSKATDGWGQNHGIVNGPIYAEGVVGSALYFDGINDYVRVPSSGSLPNNFASANNWTFEAWIKPDLQGDDYQDIFEGIYHRPRIAIILETHSLLLAGFTPSYRNLGIKDDIINNKWQHIAVTVKIINSSTANYKLYYNGKKVVDNNAYRITGNLDSSNYYIGGRQLERFRGLIDEVKIYNEALPFAQIENHYAEGAKKFNLAIK
jgi:prepilin-type N-terminal cleavage/methylation domain-containing protein